MSNLKDLQQLAEKRRTIYALNDQIPVSNEEVIKLVNMQSCIRHQLLTHNRHVSSFCLVMIIINYGTSLKKR